MQQTGIQQRLHHDGHAADAVDIRHHMLPKGFDVGQMGNLRADCGEVLQRQLHSRLVRDGEQMQHRVGRPAECHHYRDRVLERFLGQDVACGDAAAQQFDDGLTAAAREAVAPAVGGRRGCATWQRHAQRFGR